MKYLLEKQTIYRVVENENGMLEVYREYYTYKKSTLWHLDGRLYSNAGKLIRKYGGEEAFLNECKDIDDIKTFVYELNVEKKLKIQKGNSERAKYFMKRDNAIKNEYEEVFSGEVTECTPDNIRTLLRYLCIVNWGLWRLPRMTISYSCNQYDCDGKTAVTIRLDEPIEYEGEMVDKFVHGAPSRHLMNYTRI